METKTLHHYVRNTTIYKHSKYVYEEILHQLFHKARDKHNTALPFNFAAWQAFFFL